MNPNDVYRTFIETGNAMAEAQYGYRQLDDQTKSILAQNTMMAKDVDGVKSMSEAKEIALAAVSYRDHLGDVAKAQLVYLKAKVKYEACKALFDSQRTVEATERAANRSAT